MLEIAFRISEDVIFKTSRGACPHNPWRLLPLVLLHSNPPYHKRAWIRSRKWSCYFGDLNGEEKAAIRWLFEIEFGGEGDQKFCELISEAREVLGIAEQVQIAR